LAYWAIYRAEREFDPLYNRRTHLIFQRDHGKES